MVTALRCSRRCPSQKKRRAHGYSHTSPLDSFRDEDGAAVAALVTRELARRDARSSVDPLSRRRDEGTVTVCATGTDGSADIIADTRPSETECDDDDDDAAFDRKNDRIPCECEDDDDGGAAAPDADAAAVVLVGGL